MTCQLHKHNFQLPGKSLSYINTYRIPMKHKPHGESAPLKKKRATELDVTSHMLFHCLNYNFSINKRKSRHITKQSTYICA